MFILNENDVTDKCEENYFSTLINSLFLSIFLGREFILDECLAEGRNERDQSEESAASASMDIDLDQDDHDSYDSNAQQSLR